MDKPEHQRGVAFPFWARMEQMRGDMTVKRLSDLSQVRRQTYMELQRTTRRPRRDIVLALAAAVGLDADEALKLAGLNPADSDTVRLAIAMASNLSPKQKAALNAQLDAYEADAAPPANAARRPRLSLAS